MGSKLHYHTLTTEKFTLLSSRPGGISSAQRIYNLSIAKKIEVKICKTVKIKSEINNCIQSASYIRIGNPCVKIFIYLLVLKQKATLLSVLEWLKKLLCDLGWTWSGARFQKKRSTWQPPLLPFCNGRTCYKPNSLTPTSPLLILVWI